MKNQYRVVYQPRGAALEYAPMACNLYNGCTHGCKYCYAPRCLKRDRSDFHAARVDRDGVLAKLERDLAEMRDCGDTRQVMFCFTTDPYCEPANPLTRAALELMRKYDHPFTVLTKGGMRAAPDFYLYRGADSFATTLTFNSAPDSLAWEPGAALPAERIQALRTAKSYGIKTWVSFEPVIDPDQIFTLLEHTLPFVDGYKVGKASGYEYPTPVDWISFVRQFRKVAAGKEILIKRSLKEYDK